MKPVTDKAYKLFHDGTLALAQVEANGIRMDVDYLNKAITHTTHKIDRLSDKMKQHKVSRTWKKHYGSRTNMGSRQQLGKILFDVMDYDCPSLTKTGRYQTNEAVLVILNLDFTNQLLKVEKLKKARSTYLRGILKHVVDGYLHPSFGLNIAVTFRGNCTNPNFQNIPIRETKIAKLIRQAFIARKNHRIVEVDYGGVEICSATCYHHDPQMISYIEDETKDLHRDMAMQIYMLRKKLMTKNIRYCGKNMFVFPQFFGDYYIHCAQHLWEAMSKMYLKTADGVGLKKHLKSKGIKKLGRCNPKFPPASGTFEKHLKEVENDFWNKRFPVYEQWKKDWWSSYEKKGYFDTLTGFRIEGLLNRKECINYPIQGTAFHWLLWSLIRIQKLLNKYKMKSLIVGQIHDSIVGDVHRKEKRNYLEICKQVMTVDVRKHWPWIIVPLSIEAEVAPVGGNWYEKKEVKI